MIFIRECQHSDDTARKTKHPERCEACFYLANHPQDATQGALVRAPQPKGLKAYQEARKLKQGPKIETTEVKP